MDFVDPEKVADIIKQNPMDFVGLAGVYRTQAFLDTMVHRVPDAICVNRIQAVVTYCKDKKVLHLGCRGQSKEPSELHGEISTVATELWGVDIAEMDIPNFILCNLDSSWWYYTIRDRLSIRHEKSVDFDLIVASEILEHLANAGQFFENCRKFKCPIVVTVPNAYCNSRFSIMRKGIEYDNVQHLAYYSYNTLKRLLERYGFNPKKFYWVDSVMPFFARGIMFYAE
jgi:hypothetical protein